MRSLQIIDKIQTKTEALGKGWEGCRTRNMVEGQRLSSNSNNWKKDLWSIQSDAKKKREKRWKNYRYKNIFYSYLPSDFISLYINLYICIYFLLISTHYRKETVCTTEFDVTSELQRVFAPHVEFWCIEAVVVATLFNAVKNIVWHCYTWL